jgi:hypothetical protein
MGKHNSRVGACNHSGREAEKTGVSQLSFDLIRCAADPDEHTFSEVELAVPKITLPCLEAWVVVLVWRGD